MKKWWTGLVDQMIAMVLNQSYVTQWRSLFTLISYFGIISSFFPNSTDNWFFFAWWLFVLFLLNNWVIWNNKSINQCNERVTEHDKGYKPTISVYIIAITATREGPRWPFPQNFKISSISCHFVLWGRCPKQNTVARLKSKDLAPPRNLGWRRHWLLQCFSL